MKTQLKRTVLILSFFAMIFSSWAQSPEKFSYQAVVRNANDALLTNSPIGIRVSILQGSASGSTVFSETHTATSNDNSLVTIEIGNGTTGTGSIQAIDWSAGPYFIKNELDVAGGTSYTLTGVSQLLSVPYAEFAKNGLPTGTQGNTLRVDSNGDWTADNFLYNDGQYVGINHSSPIGSSVFDISKTTSGNDFGGMYINTTSPDGRPFLGFATDGYARAWFEFRGTTQNLSYYNGSNYVFTISADNKVGINNQNPQNTLDVSGSLRFNTGTSATNRVLIGTSVDGSANWGQVGDDQIQDIPRSIYYSHNTFSDNSSVNIVAPNGAGYVFENNFTEALKGSIAVPSDWDGTSTLFAEVFFYQQTTAPGSAGFFLRVAGIAAGESYTTDPGSTNGTLPTMSTIPGTLHKQTFSLPSSISADDDFIRFFGIQRNTVGTHTDNIVFVGLKLRYMAKR